MSDRGGKENPLRKTSRFSPAILNLHERIKNKLFLDRTRKDSNFKRPHICATLFQIEKCWFSLVQGNRIWSLRLLKAGSTSWGSGAINSDRGCRNAEEPAS